MPARQKPVESKRLDVAAWIRAALDVLAVQGIDGVRIEVLAKHLGVTKGSFYWHFKDRDALIEAMLTDWRRRATLAVIERLDRTEEPAEQRLRTLLHLPFAGSASQHGADIELSVRLWGRRDPRARASLAEVDALRLHYIGRLLEQCGVPVSDVPARAIMAYCYMRVAASLIDSANTELAGQCEALLSRK